MISVAEIFWQNQSGFKERFVPSQGKVVVSTLGILFYERL